MAPPITRLRLRPLSLLRLLPRPAFAHPLSTFSSSSSADNKCGSGPDTPRPQAPVDEQRPPLNQSRTAQQDRRRKEKKQTERRWQRSAVVAALTPAQAASVATTHPDPVGALDLLVFLSRERSHEYSPDTFATLALRLVEARKCPADVGRARVHMIRSCRTQPEMTRAMDDLDVLARRGPRMDLMAYGALLVQLNKLGMTATLMDSYRRLLREGLKPNLLIYNTVINALCKDGNVRDARSVMEKMVSKESGMKPDAFAYSSMILGYCKKNDLASAIQVFARMRKRGCEPNAAAYSNLINGLCDSGRVDEALDMMGEMKRRATVLPTAYDLTAPIAALCGMGRTEDAWRLFVDMKKKGCRPNVYTYTSLIRGQQAPRVAIGLFHRMARDGVLPDTVTYTALLNVLVEDRKIDSALVVCDAMQRHGCLPDTITCNEMIKGYCAAGDTDKAMAMLTSLLKGSKPKATLVTYNTIIKGYCDSGNTSAARRILELMKANGCEPDEWSYNELISAFCKVRDMESASRLFNEMAGHHGLRPDEVTYTTLISGYCKDEKLDRAAEMLERMKGSGCRPTVRTYNVLIHALTKQNDFSAAEKLCEVMLEEKISLDVVTYSAMIDGLCRNGATSLALEMLSRMVENSCLPTLHTYTCLIQALGQEGKVEEAEQLFSDLLRQGHHTLDEVAFIKMIEVYIISGKVDRAFDLLGKMINAGCQPTLWTYDVLIKGLQNEHLMGDHQKLVSLPDAAFDDEAVKEHAISALSSKLADLDPGLSRQLNDALLSGLSRSGRWFEAYKLYRSMVGQGLCPNQEAYNDFMVSVLRPRKVDLAMGVFRHMSAQHRELHLSGYKALICALCQLQRRKEARSVFEHMLSRAFDPDNIVWTVLVDGLLGAGYKDLCMEFLQIMERNDRKPSFRSYNILAKETLKKHPSLEE